jgi:hypothetical protein
MFCQRRRRPEKWQSRYVIRRIRIVHGNFGKLGFFQNYPTQLNCTKEIAYRRGILKRRHTVRYVQRGVCVQQILSICANPSSTAPRILAAAIATRSCPTGFELGSVVPGRIWVVEPAPLFHEPLSRSLHIRASTPGSRILDTLRHFRRSPGGIGFPGSGADRVAVQRISEMRPGLRDSAEPQCQYPAQILSVRSSDTAAERLKVFETVRTVPNAMHVPPMDGACTRRAGQPQPLHDASKS